MITRRPNRLDLLILDDVSQHPGTSKNACIERLMAHYQSYSYIRNRITWLISSGHLAAIPEGNRVCLNVVKLITPR